MGQAEILIFAPFVFMAGALLWAAGRSSAKYPSNEEMMQRLVDSYVADKHREVGKASLVREIAKRGDEKASRGTTRDWPATT